MEPDHQPTCTNRRPKPHPVIAWIIVSLLVGLTAAATALFTDANGAATEADATSASTKDAEDQQPTDLDAGEEQEKTSQGSALVTLQGKMQLGELLLNPASTSAQSLVHNDQPVQRIRGAILLSIRPSDPPTWPQVLQEIVDDQDATEAHQSLARLTASVLEGHGDANDQAVLARDLGYFGALAWAKEHNAEALSTMKLEATAAVMLVSGILLGALGLGLVGLVLGIVALVRLAKGTMQSGMGPSDTLHGLYVETFLVWFLLLNAFSVVAALLAEATGVPVMAAASLGFAGSLLCVAWPSLRGSSFARTRIDIGWTRGKGMLRELGAGVVCWLGMLPILGVGLLGTIVLMLIAGVQEGDTDAPSHPIFDSFSDGPLPIAALVLAVVMAPLVEETVFRGLLYRQLRSVGAFGRTTMSCLLSAAITGFIFAAIHPQGLLGIPALMSIGFAMALAREWRGSLIAPMVMHGMNNGLVLAAVLIVLRL